MTKTIKPRDRYQVESMYHQTVWVVVDTKSAPTTVLCAYYPGDNLWGHANEYEAAVSLAYAYNHGTVA